MYIIIKFNYDFWPWLWFEFVIWFGLTWPFDLELKTQHLKPSGSTGLSCKILMLSHGQQIQNSERKTVILETQDLDVHSLNFRIRTLKTETVSS